MQCKPKIYLINLVFEYLIYILIYGIKNTESLWTIEGNKTLNKKLP